MYSKYVKRLSILYKSKHCKFAEDNNFYERNLTLFVINNKQTIKCVETHKPIIVFCSLKVLYDCVWVSWSNLTEKNSGVTFFVLYVQETKLSYKSNQINVNNEEEISIRQKNWCLSRWMVLSMPTARQILAERIYF